MKYIYLVFLIAFFIAPATAITQTNTTGNYRIVFSTPDKPIVNTPTHMELHIQHTDTANMVGDLEVEELIVHLQEHRGNETHNMSEGNISQIHKDIPHRTLLDMKKYPNEPPGHYHANYTFNEPGLYEVIVQFKSNGDNITSVFSLNVEQKKFKNEMLKLNYTVLRVFTVSLILVSTILMAIRKKQMNIKQQ